MKGLALTTLTPQKTSNGSQLFTLNLPGRVVNIVYCSGLTRLVFSYVFNMFSDFNPETLTGSTLLKLLAAPIITDSDKSLAEILISEEIESLTERFKTLQNRSGVLIPAKERLSKAEITGINIVTDFSPTRKVSGSAEVNFSIYNELGQRGSIST